MAGILEFTLERDGHDQPWGFRLQGGHDVGMPLSIQRVLVGTPADGIVKKGDVLLRISQTDAKGLSHQQAADLFTNTGNQISFQVKRAGAQSQNVNANSSVAHPPSVPVSGMTKISPRRSPDTLLLNLPKSRGGTKPHSSTIQHSTSAPLSLTIQNQVAGTLQQIQHQQSISPLPLSHPEESGLKPNLPVTGASKSPVPMQSLSGSGSKQYYNNPINLYSSENVAEIAKMNKMGISGLPVTTTSSSPSGLIHPNKIQQVVLTPSKDYNPKDSATWQALHESDPTIVDPENLENYTSLREHDPIYSEVYTPSKNPQPRKSASPQPASLKAAPSDSSNENNENILRLPGRSPNPSPRRSPVADLLPSSFGSKMEESKQEATSSEPQQSAVLAAALAESKPNDSQSSLLESGSLPLYETNSIGGRKKIAQSATFNKVMMDVLGE